MIRLHELNDVSTKRLAWKKFAKHHYSPNVFNVAARTFLVTETFDGKEVLVGLTAALAQPSGTVLNAWRSHKVVALPSGSTSGVWGSTEKITLPEFSKADLWRQVADAQAKLFVGEGHRYFCNASDAPAELVAYRNDPDSGWVPTSKNGKAPNDRGHGAKFGCKSRATNAKGLMVSHEYVGYASAGYDLEACRRISASRANVTHRNGERPLQSPPPHRRRRHEDKGRISPNKHDGGRNREGSATRLL